MTLIAAFKAEGIPVLVGDLLLTAKGEKSGTRKKIIVLADNLAIAWTGDLIAAKLIIRELKEKFNDNRTTKQHLESTLTSLPLDDIGGFSIHLIGWIIDNDAQYCFRWNSLWPHDVFYDDNVMIDGSGSPLIKRLIGEGNLNGVGTKQKTEKEIVDWIAYMLLSINTTLMHFILFPSDIESTLHSGYSFETIYYSNEGIFKYLDCITYIGIYSFLNEHGKYLRSQIAPVIYKHDSLNNSTKITTFNIEKNHQNINFISAPNQDEDIPRDIKPFLKTSLKSRYKCICIQINSPNHPPFMTQLVDQSDKEDLISITENSINIKIQNDIIEKIFDMYKTDYNRKHRL